MRNSLLELPILLCCIWGGLVSGLVCALFLLPRRLYIARLRGRRAGVIKLILLAFSDITAALALVSGFALTLYTANGGELRIYAVCGFFAAAALAGYALHRACLG